MPLLHTPDFVLQKLRTGSPLMTPGLQRGPPFPALAIKNAVVAVASLEKPSVPMVVGICEIEVASLQQVQGAKGHAVRGEHWDGDEIWAWSSSGKPGGIAPESIEGWDVKVEEAKISGGLEDLHIGEQNSDLEDGGVPLGPKSGNPDSKNHNAYVEGEDGRPFEEVDKVEKEYTTKGKSRRVRVCPPS